ncbi:SHOCT domain-containing protein [Gordonia terrae]|uniref:SHOCT domain-containing protein n=1 Tax=Gordonia terrae TaxID=2055 RepID=UPI002009FA29|nr:SHOCT domain-containing protein [Gordonia terrae]UPW08548.1 SHOCT domain-containing protein [Gordonia terrae]
MAQVSSKVKEKNAVKWESSLQEKDLYQGEVVWAFVNGRRMKPVTQGAAITNARIIGFLTNQAEPKHRVPLEVFADEVRGFDFEGKGMHMRVLTDAGEVDFGPLDKSEVEFAKYYVEYLWRSGVAPEVREARESVAREQAAEAAVTAELLGRRNEVRVIGPEMKDKWWDAIARHSHADELPWFVINGGSAGRLVAFEDRLLITKTGGMTSFMAGSLGGGRETTFPYSEITNIEFNGGFATGVLEVLTPSYQGSGNHDYWRSSNKGRNNAHDDPWTLSNCLPLAKVLYQEAQPLLNEMQRKIADAKRPQVIVQHAPPSTAAAIAGGGGLAHELEKLAEMHQRGLLDDEEFKAAKRAAIAKMA